MNEYHRQDAPHIAKNTANSKNIRQTEYRASTMTSSLSAPHTVKNLPACVWLWSALAFASPALALDAPDGLLCDLIPNRDAPIVSEQPSFSWIVGPAEPASVQGGYHLQVASSIALLNQNMPDLWDSGMIDSAQSVGVRYAGKQLAPGSTWYWRVQVRNTAKELSPFSQATAVASAKTPGLWPKLPLTTTRVSPHSQTTTSERSLRCDFGRAAFGWAEISFPASVAEQFTNETTLTIRLGEKIDSTGAIDRKPGATIRFAETKVSLKPKQTTYRVKVPADKRNTEKKAVLLPPEFGVVMPFRYVEIDNSPAQVTCTQVAVHYPFDEQAASFTSNDETLNAVWELCRYSIKATTFCGVYVDGDRERVAYEADAYINQLGHYNTDRSYALARHSYEYLLENPTWPTEWAQHMVLMAWTDWMYTGDLAAVERSWDRLVKEKSLLHRMRPDGLLNTNKMRDIVDWPAGERDKFDMTPVNTVVNAFHCRVLQCLGDLAEALGKKADAERYRADAARVIKAFNATFLNPKTGIYVDGEGSQHSSQHANLWPLAFKLVPPENLAKVRQFVVDKKMACSVYPAQFLLSGLFDNGGAESAIALMTSTSDRSWWNMLKQGSTMTLEAWSLGAKNNLDWNHAWGAAPANIIPCYILGVTPITAGGELLSIKPQLGALMRVSGTVPTMRGPVAIKVDHPKNAPYTLTVTVPGNTRAKIEIGDYRGEVGPGEHVITGN